MVSTGLSVVVMAIVGRIVLLFSVVVVFMDASCHCFASFNNLFLLFIQYPYLYGLNHPVV